MFDMSKKQSAVKSLLAIGIIISAAPASTAMAQEVRYSWVDMSFMQQNADIAGTQATPVAGQTVDANGVDGNGIRFRGSAGTWHNLYMFVDFASTDMDVFAVVNNAGGAFPADDEFDFTTLRTGLGLRFPIGLGPATDLYAELTYDSIDLDFGSFAGENFDTENKDIGGVLGIRAMLNDNIELRVHGRYTNHGDANLTNGEFDADAVYGAGFGWQIIRGFSIVGDFESGEFGSWSVGFRLDLDED